MPNRVDLQIKVNSLRKHLLLNVRSQCQTAIYLLVKIFNKVPIALAMFGGDNNVLFYESFSFVV